MASQSSVTNQKLYQARLLLDLMPSLEGAQANAVEDGAVSHLMGAWRSYMLELADNYKTPISSEQVSLALLANVLPGVQEVREFEVLMSDPGSWLSRLEKSYKEQIILQGHRAKHQLIGVDIDANVSSWLTSFKYVIELQRENRIEF
jgi:hypothetical protein